MHSSAFHPIRASAAGFQTSMMPSRSWIIMAVGDAATADAIRAEYAANFSANASCSSIDRRRTRAPAMMPAARRRAWLSGQPKVCGRSEITFSTPSAELS